MKCMDTKEKLQEALKGAMRAGDDIQKATLRMTLAAIRKDAAFKDVPVIMAITFGVSILVVLFNVLVDILYAVLDPRIRIT